MTKQKRLTAWLLCLVILMTALPLRAEAYGIGDFSFTIDNPAYEDIGVSIDIPEAATSYKKQAVGGVYLEKEDLATALRASLVRHDAQFSARINIAGGGTNAENWKDNLRQMVLEVYQAAVRHTGAPFEGDYIKFHFGGLTANAYSVANDLTRFNCNLVLDLRYYGTLADDNYVDNETDRILKSLDVEGKTNYEKIKAIHQYVSTHVSYDYEHMNDDSYNRMFTAYAALYDGKAVCQGFANLVYVLALKASVDCRIIGGNGINPASGVSIPHAWNIVKIGNRYYNIDPTWDAETLNHDTYFLQSPSTFGGRHIRDAEYQTNAFHSRYPMALSDYAHTYTGRVTDVQQTWVSRTLMLGDSFPVYGISTVSPASASDKSVSFHSTDSNVLQIIGSNAVAVSEGKAGFIVRSNDGAIESYCEVTVLGQSRFPDFWSGPYYTRQMVRALFYGFISGTDTGVLIPDEGCTRAQALTMLHRVAGSPTGYSDISRFTDVPANAYYANALKWALDRSITAGVSEDRFGPNEVCTREQIVVFLWRAYSNIIPYDRIPLYIDVPEARFSFDAIQWAGLNNVVSGTGNNMFTPTMPCTRGQIVVMLDKIISIYGLR